MEQNISIMTKIEWKKTSSNLFSDKVIKYISK